MNRFTVKEKRDYYEVLGISKNAGSEEIKQAYRKLARQYHPDVAENKSEAEKHFKEINEAFSVLSNPEKRDQYDRFGHSAVSDVSAGFNFSGGFEIFEDLLGSFFGEPSRRQNSSSRGSDLRYDLELSLEEAFTGISPKIGIKSGVACAQCQGRGAKEGDLQQCQTCHGTGQLRQIQQSIFGRVVRTTACHQCQGEGQILKNPCKNCHGNGIVQGDRKLTVQIPAGVDDENRIRLTGEGEAGFRGGPPGDLYLFIHVKPHSKFKREDLNIFYEAAVSFPEAALGNEIEIPTLGGKETVQIAPGTQNGAAIRLKGKGMPSVNGFARGDQFVIIKVDVPKKLTEKQKQLLGEWAQISGIKLNLEKGFLGRVKDALS